MPEMKSGSSNKSVSALFGFIGALAPVVAGAFYFGSLEQRVKNIEKLPFEYDAIPPGTVLLTNDTKCPENWRQLPNSADHYVIGSSLTKTSGTTGGSDVIVITADQVPGHTHVTGNYWGIQIDDRGINEFISPGSFTIPPGSQAQAITGSNNEQSSTHIPFQPPYISLLFCVER